MSFRTTKEWGYNYAR